MSIVANKIRQEGNTFFIKSNPAVGILTLTGFIDDAAGEAGPVMFQKLFRYTRNGVIYGDWQELTTTNLIALTFNPKDIVVFELQYFKQEPAGSNLLTVSEVTINDTAQVLIDSTYFKNSIFYSFFGSESTEVLNWYVNLLEKLYAKGLIPNYIERMDDFGSPDDFISFWRSVAKFFSYFVIYARKYQLFYQSEVLLSEYLEQRGLKTSVENDIVELNYLMENFYLQVFERGTNHIVDQVENGDPIDGELLRLIYYKRAEDEFLFNLYKPEHFGWNLRNSSPLYKGLYLNDNLNKSYETKPEVTDLSKYPTQNCSIVIDEGKSVMLIANGGISASGGLKKIKVSADMDYEISFLIKKEAGNNLTFGLTAYDKDGLQISLKSHKTGGLSNNFFSNVDLSRNDKYVLVRCFLYNKSKTPQVNDDTEIHQGQDLILSANITHIIPSILVSGVSAYLYSLRIIPIQTEYSRGLLQVNNFISCWLTNRNKSFTTIEIKEYIIKYLIPYNAFINLTEIGLVPYDAQEEPRETTYWVGAGNYCRMVTFIGGDPSCELINLIWVPEEETAYCEQTSGTGVATINWDYQLIAAGGILTITDSTSAIKAQSTAGVLSQSGSFTTDKVLTIQQTANNSNAYIKVLNVTNNIIIYEGNVVNLNTVNLTPEGGKTYSITGKA